MHGPLLSPNDPIADVRSRRCYAEQVAPSYGRRGEEEMTLLNHGERKTPLRLIVGSLSNAELPVACQHVTVPGRKLARH
jgi:hypothetical protein